MFKIDFISHFKGPSNIEKFNNLLNDIGLKQSFFTRFLDDPCIANESRTCHYRENKNI